MKALIRLGVAAAALALTAGAASGAGGLRIVEAAGTAYPEKSFILTLPEARSLKTSDLTVTENGVRAHGITVARQGTVNSKSAVVLVIDESLTMRGKPIVDAFAAARAFAARATPDQEIAIVTFNGSVQVVQPFTFSADVISRALDKPPKLVYGTKNYDALLRSLALISDANVPSGSIIMLTDGQDVGSVAKPGPTLSALAKAHVRVFPVGLVSKAYKPDALQQMATMTGGVYVAATGPSKLRPILIELGRQLSNEYLLTYRSRANPGTHVAVKVSVRGISGPAATDYVTPALHLTSAPPYKPATSDKLIQSRWTMLVIVLLFAGLLFFAITFAARAKTDPLVDRVGDFVSVQRPERGERVFRKPSTVRPAFLTRRRDPGARPGWSERMAAALELADIELVPGQLILLTAAATFLVIFFLLLTIGPVGIVIGLLTPLLVRALIRFRISRKRRAFAEQLPDNLDVLASALRAGHSLVGALTVVADDAPEPAKSEFRRVLAEEQFGSQLEDAFQVVVTRMDNSDLDQVALVARLQREMGTNSAEVLDRVIETVRARMELRRLVRTLTAQGRLSRWVLTILPIALALVMTLLSRSYMHPLFHQVAGRILLGFAAVMVALGSFVIGKIIDIEV